MRDVLHDASTQIARVLPIPRVKLSAKPDLVGLYSNIPAGAAAHKFEGGWWVLGPRPHTAAGQKVAASQGQRKLGTVLSPSSFLERLLRQRRTTYSVLPGSETEGEREHRSIGCTDDVLSD